MGIDSLVSAYRDLSSLLPLLYTFLDVRISGDVLRIRIVCDDYDSLFSSFSSLRFSPDVRIDVCDGSSRRFFFSDGIWALC